MPNVLVTSAGRRVALVRSIRSAIRTLGGGRVIAADVTANASAMHDADKSVVVPRCDTPEYVPALLELCRRERIVLIVPTIDTELLPLSRARNDFSRVGVMVAVSGPQTVEIGYDKLSTAQFFARSGIPAPVLLNLDHVLAGTNGSTFPMVLKPRFGSGSIGVHVIHEREALGFFSRSVREPVLQEYVPGVEFTLDVLVGPDSRCVCVVPRCRLETRAGEISKGYTVRDPDLEGWGRRAVECLPDAFGPITLQCFKRLDGSLAFIEINPRFGGGFPLSCEAGADYPRWLLEWALGLRSTASDATWRANVAMYRYDDAVFVRSEVI